MSSNIHFIGLKFWVLLEESLQESIKLFSYIFGCEKLLSLLSERKAWV